MSFCRDSKLELCACLDISPDTSMYSCCNFANNSRLVCANLLYYGLKYIHSMNIIHRG
jgi:hypothetical protein